MSTVTRLKRKPHVVYNLSYHLVWCPKYRRPVLVDEIATRLEEILLEKAEELSVTVESLSIQPDHVHLFIRTEPRHAPQFVVNQLKGISSRRLREEFPSLKSRLPTLWTRSYFVDSVGVLNEFTVRKYIESQRGK